MLIFVVDDEPAQLRSAQAAIREAYPDSEIYAFGYADEALEAISGRALTPDAVFSDIEMPDKNGLEFAVQVKKCCPNARIVFVTGYSQYAVDAYKLHVPGYVMKPLKAERVREELSALPAAKSGEEPVDKLRIQCFGYFEVFWHGEPLIFSRAKTKELFAYIVDRDGEACTSAEIIAALWEDARDEAAAKHNLRTVISDLRATLREIDMEKILIRERRQLAIRPDMVDCDYYKMKHGDVSAVNSFKGEYMKQYSWAMFTEGRLSFEKV